MWQDAVLLESKHREQNNPRCSVLDEIEIKRNKGVVDSDRRYGIAVLSAA